MKSQKFEFQYYDCKRNLIQTKMKQFFETCEADACGYKEILYYRKKECSPRVDHIVIIDSNHKEIFRMYC